jgi:hypothetical protein
VWKYDGAQATLVAQIQPEADSSQPVSLEVHEGSLYFGGHDDAFGNQLWKYNSSIGVAERVTSNLGFVPENLATLAGVLYFWERSSHFGPVRLWSYDGVQATPVADFLDASSVFRFKGTLYFGADDGLHGSELWKLEPDVLAGDLNRDGQVSIADFINLSSNFGKTNAGWSQGDLNYDGAVTVSDFIDLAANFGRSSVQPPAATALAETVDDSAALKRGANRTIHHKNATHRQRHHRREQQKMGGRWLGR